MEQLQKNVGGAVVFSFDSSLSHAHADTHTCAGSNRKLTPPALFSSPDVTFAAKGYFDALVRMGELASESQGSKDLGECYANTPT